MLIERTWKRWVYFYIPLTVFVVGTLFPFYWMLITAIRPDAELYRSWRAATNTPFWTLQPTLEHFRDLMAKTTFPQWLWNTFFIAVVSTAISLFCGLLAGYALARLRFPMAGTLGTSIFVTYLVPPTLLFIPLANIIRTFQLGDTPWALILTYPTFLIPFCTWLLMGYFKTIPKELEECARIDGATRFGAMLRIIFPIAVPGILSAGIFAFTLSWNEFIYALVFLSSPEKKTVPVGVVSELIRGDIYFWGQLMAGEMTIGTRVVNNLPPKDRDIAMLFQNYALYPHMTVYDNMAFGLKMRKFPKVEIQKRVQDAAEILGIQELLKRKPRQLSGGQRQRVAVGRAIVRHPQVFLFDEPLSNLDAKLRVQMRVELKRLHERLETTAIYVTHDQVEAMTLGDRVVVMKDGWIQQVGEPLELYGKPANKFVAGFIGSPAMNFVDVKVVDANGALWAETQGLRVKVPPTHTSRLVPYKGQQVTLGVRPEDLQLASGSDPSEYVFDAVVDVVEPLGSEILLDLRAGNSTIVARVEPTVRLKVHEKTRLALTPDRAHFFDLKTELAI